MNLGIPRRLTIYDGGSRPQYKNVMPRGDVITILEQLQHAIHFFYSLEYPSPY
jgi:hypothetical protein